MCKSCAKISAENERLRGVLKRIMPYLEDAYLEDGEDDESVGWNGDGTEIPLTFGDIRLAREALGEKSR